MAAGFTEYITIDAIMLQLTRFDLETEMKTKKSEGTLFIGCGLKASDYLTVGAFSTPAALFASQPYTTDTPTDATQNRNYFSYYSSGEDRTLGFSAVKTVFLWKYSPKVSSNDHKHAVDIGAGSHGGDIGAESRLSLSLTAEDWCLYRCGSVQGDYLQDTRYKLVMYYHPGQNYQVEHNTVP